MIGTWRAARPSLERRIRRRMDAAGCEGFGDYLDYLEVHPDEFAQLFDTLGRAGIARHVA